MNFETPMPAVSEHGDRVAMAVGNVVAIYELPSRNLIRSITHTAPVSALAFARAGRDLVSGSTDGSLFFTPDDRDSVVLRRFPVGVDAVGLTEDRRLLVAGPRSHFSVYDLQRNVVLAELQSPIRIRAFRLSADGLRLITIPKSGLQATAALWDLTRYRLIAPLRGSIGQVFGARFVHGDRDILTATNDGSPRLWDGYTGVLKQRFLGNDQYLVDAALSPDGSLIVGGGGDGMLRFWDAITGRMIWAFRAHRSGLAGIHFEGNDIVTRGFTGEISRWSIPAPPPPEAIDRIVRCLPLRFDEDSGGLVEQAPCAEPQSFTER